MGESVSERVALMAPLRLKNLASSGALLAIACAGYAFAPHNRGQMDALHGTPGFSFTGLQFLHGSAWVYFALLCLLYLGERSPTTSKSLRFVRVVSGWMGSTGRLRWRELSNEDRVAVLTTLLKAFFAPMMLMSLMNFATRAIANAVGIIESGIVDLGFLEIFDAHGFWLLMQVILFVDVLIFTVGYVVEHPRLGNQIRSVDPTLIGWGVTLACYPPFNTLTGAILGSAVSDFPQFDDPTWHVTLNVLLLILMAIYAWASVALGFKASNLTHRGIIARGPYRYVRHPAYLCKNMAWWIGALPLIAVSFDESLFAGLLAIASVVGWSMIYVLRALTEEDHLRKVDGEYAAYAAQVRYRFIPGVY